MTSTTKNLHGQIALLSTKQIVGLSPRSLRVLHVSAWISSSPPATSHSAKTRTRGELGTPNCPRVQVVQTNRELHTDANLDLLLNSPGASPVSPHSSAFRVQTSPTTPKRGRWTPAEKRRGTSRRRKTNRLWTFVTLSLGDPAFYSALDLSQRLN